MDYLRRYIDIDDNILYYIDLMIILNINDDDNIDNDEELFLINIEKKVE
jgi:hypothetical protein